MWLGAPVRTDTDIKSLTGGSRPIMPIAERTAKTLKQLYDRRQAENNFECFVVGHKDVTELLRTFCIDRNGFALRHRNSFRITAS
jgi:hypothetical protein